MNRLTLSNTATNRMSNGSENSPTTPDSPSILAQENEQVSPSLSPLDDIYAISALMGVYAESGAGLINNNEPRLLFTSLVNLWRDWHRMPMDALFQSVLVFEWRKTWFFESECSNFSESEMKSKAYKRCKKILAFLEDRSDNFRAFQSMIAQKDKQGLILWLDPLYKLAHTDDSSNDSPEQKIDDLATKIDPKWKIISDFISSIVDPVRQEKYYALQLNDEWWVKRCQRYRKQTRHPERYEDTHEDMLTQFEFCCNRKKLQPELENLQFRHKAMLEILHQSNPTMVPMLRWSNEVWEIKSAQIMQYRKSLSAIGIDKDWDLIRRCDDDNVTELCYDNDEELVSSVAVKSLRVPTFITNKANNFVYCFE